MNKFEMPNKKQRTQFSLCKTTRSRQLKSEKNFNKSIKSKKSKTNLAVDNFFKNMNVKLKKKPKRTASNKFKRSNISSYNVNSGYRKDMKRAKNRNSQKHFFKNKKSENQEIKKKSNKNEIEKLLNNFSLYSKNPENAHPINNLSISMIRHSSNNNIPKNTHNKSIMTDPAELIMISKKKKNIPKTRIENVISYSSGIPKLTNVNISGNKKFSFLYFSKKSISSNESTERSKSEKENNILKDCTNPVTFSQLKESIPKKYEEIFEKIVRKIKIFEEKNQNLERQLRNRNKDFLYFLKQIEKEKSDP